MSLGSIMFEPENKLMLLVKKEGKRKENLSAFVF